ncbi:uncharacterized protein LOC126838746 isoform X2 [Adelges cooleyi]|uniref:uncharacterized protein LOC126838746 isoform X2 n=1 Tax=Adelges cooleyi TaxID=133065 RepID=UPI00217F3F06|nr:uncharacterized protein LOC126838746 isoform X2 [Adelges cooleyi]
MDTKYFGFITILKKNGSISSRCPIISKEFNIGRSSNNDIRIYLDSVSNNHCSILFVDNKAYIRDRSKAGSTKVNGKKIGRNNFLLRESDEIDISDRKLIFNYASLSSKTSWIRTDCTSLRTQISSPLVNSKKQQTPSKTITPTPSKRSVHPPRTPIVETNNHISNESFEELKKKPCDEVLSNKTKPELIKSFSVTSGQNIPVLNNSKTPRKSWKTSNMSSSSARILDILSSDRKKRDVTPEMNTSYRFLDEEVEYDSPIPICDQEDLFEESVNTNVTGVDSSKMSEQILNNDNDVDGNNVNWQPSSSIAVDSNLNLNLPESTPSISRRETYSIEDAPKVIEQNSTPAPRRSILKCSKTAKTCRSRSNNRMVQFARLPKTDSKIKSTKFYSGNSFTVIDDKSADNDHSQVNQKDKSFNIEDTETDDLDGVRPLDTSVSSLMSSPILDQVTLNKSSSKRGSRGNKVMSLISSFEKRTYGSPIQNLKASDLLNMNVSRNEEASSNKSPEDTTTSILQKSSTSLRRINLEDMFVAEDSMKNSLQDSEDKSMIEGINLNSTQNTETLDNTISKESSVGKLDSSKILENTFETETILDDVKISDYNQSSVKVIVDSPEEEFAFASPLNMNPGNYLCDTDAAVNWVNQNSFSEKENSICEMINTTENNASQVNEIIEKTPVFKSQQLNHNNSKIIETSSDENTNKSARDKTIENADLSNIIENSIAENDKCKDSSKLSQKNDDTNKTNNGVQEDFTESIEHLDNLEIVQNDHNAFHSKTHISDKAVMSEMGNVTFDKLEDTNSNEDCSALIEENAANKSVEKNCEELDLNKSDDISKKTTSESSSNNYVLSPMENLNEKLIDSIESQLNIIHNGIDTSNSDKENSLGNISNKVTLNINEQPTTREDIDHNKTQNASEVVIIDVNTVDKSVKNDDSKVYLICNEASTVTTVDNDVYHTENVQDISEKTSNICIKAASPINLTDTVGNVEPSIHFVESVSNIEPNIKQTLQAQMSTSKKSTKHILENDIGNCNLNNLVELTKTFNESDEELEEDIENLNTTDKHFEQTLNTSIGKPQYESTPWNWSKNSKLPFNSTTDIEESKNTIQDDVSEDNSKQKKKGISMPLFDPDLWSQRMKDFNESVKKASVSETSNINAKPSSKVLFSESNQNISKELPEHESSVPKSVKGRLSKTNSVIQCPTITTCSPNSTTIAFDQVLIGNKRTTRSHNKSPEKTSTELENKVIQSMSTKNKSVKAKSPQINTKSEDESVDNNTLSLRSSRKSKSIVNETSSDTHINEKKLTVSMNATHLAEQHSSEVDNESSIMNKEQNSFKNICESKSPSKVMNRPMKNKIIILESTTDTDSETTKSDSEMDLTDSKIDSSSSQVSNRNKSNNSIFQTFSPVVTKTRRNLRTRANRNETRMSVQKQKVNKIDSGGTSVGTSADSDSDQNHSRNAQKISGQKLQEKKPQSLKTMEKITVENEIIIDLTNDDVGKEIPFNNDIHTSNKDIKNNSKAGKDKSQKHEKTKTTQNVKTSAVQPRARITRSNTTLTETNLPIINKNKTPSPIKYKNTKGVKKIQIKKSSVVKANKKQQLAKRIQPPKQISNNKLSETSEYETTSEIDESIQKLSPSPTVTKIQKKTTLVIAPSKKLKEKITETSATVTQSGKGSRKRAADTSAISQPKAKGRKRDHTSKVANTTMNCELISTKEKSSPTTIKRTRNTSKTKIIPGSDISLQITNEVKKEKTKSAVTRKSISPKELTTKRTRNTSKTKVLASNISLPTTNEIKKDKLKSAVTFESTSLKENTSPTTSKRTRNTSKTKVLASDISLLTTNEIKKDKPKSAVTLESTPPKENTSPTTSKRTRNTSKTTVVLVSDTSLPITNEVKKDKPKSTERARAKKRELNPHDSSVDSAPIAKKITRKALADNKELEVKKNNASLSSTKSTKAQSTDTDDTEPNISTRVRFNKNVDTKSISPRPKKTTRNTKLIETDSETIPSRVLRVREKRK